MPDLAGRTVVVTGASAGTGAAAAKQLRGFGAEVVVVGRDPARTAQVAERLDSRWFVADFAVLGDVRRLADELLRVLPRIDVLADNAGAMVRATGTTVDGNEPNYQVNALAPFLLVDLLTPRLETGGARIVSTSSDTHRGVRLMAERVGRYGRAKLAALLLHREHARRHPGLEIVDFHPGIVASDFGRYLGTFGLLATRLARPFLTAPQEAGRRLVHLATTGDAVAGRYYVTGRPVPPAPLVGDARLAEAVWHDAQRRLAYPPPAA